MTVLKKTKALYPVEVSAFALSLKATLPSVVEQATSMP